MAARCLDHHIASLPQGLCVLADWSTHRRVGLYLRAQELVDQAVPFQLDEGEATPPAWGCTMTDTLIDRNPEILGGTPVFAGTRVPVRILMEHLEAGDRLDDFLVDYPTVSRRQAVAVLERATTMLVSGGDEAAA